MESRIMLDVTAAELEVLLASGWRRFGPSYFRPRCGCCEACVSLRVPVERFVPSRSQRRVLQKCAGLRVELGAPRLDQARLRLYRAWHAMREKARGWEPDAIDVNSYALTFCFPHAAAREVAYYKDDRLVAVGITDETERAMSAVYCYYDPSYAASSLGVFNVLANIALARSRNKEHVYLGYHVAGCASLEYKSLFRPHEVLREAPGGAEPPCWEPV